MTMITPSYLGETIEYSSLHACRSTLEDPTLIEKTFSMFPPLSRRASQNAGTLSGGEQQMLVLGRAMMSEPRLLCLDEPSLGLAPLIVQDIFRTIRAINAGGTSVLLVEQNARYAFETASRGYVLQSGAIIASGACSILKTDDRVRQAYLGQSATAHSQFAATP